MEQVLEKLGFSEYKKRAYVTLVKLGRCKVGEIAKKASIPSSKVYETLRWLYENGYISLVSERPLIYKANDPKSVLKSDVRDKIAKLRALEEEICKINTNLGVSEKAAFEVVYGRNPFFKKVKEAVAKSDKSIIAIVKNWRLDYELKELTSEFVKRGGKARFLGPMMQQNKSNVAEWKRIGVLVKRFSPETTRFTVWDGKTIAIGFKDDKERDYFSLWIQNEHLGKIFTDCFNSIWNGK
jgi:sugar-specific transcriptional regulator TrmB